MNGMAVRKSEDEAARKDFCASIILNVINKGRSVLSGNTITAIGNGRIIVESCDVPVDNEQRIVGGCIKSDRFQDWTDIGTLHLWG